MAQEKRGILSPANREGRALEQYCQKSDELETRIVSGRTRLPVTHVTVQVAEDKSHTGCFGCAAPGTDSHSRASLEFLR